MTRVVAPPVAARCFTGGGAGDARRVRASRAIVGLTVMASIGLLASTGSPLLALIPPVLAISGYLLTTLPVRVPLMVFTGIWIATDIQPRLQSTDGTIWRSPLAPVTNVLSNNLDTILGISALRFSGSEAFFFLMLLIAGYRLLVGSPTDSARRSPLPNVLVVSLAVAFGAVVLLELKGVGTGGDFRQSLWQFRQLFWLPLMTVLFAAAIRGPRDLVPLAVLVTVATAFKIAIGLYYVYRIAIPNGVEVEFMTCHEDSVTFVTVVMLWTAVWAHRPSRRHAAIALLAGTWTLIGMTANARRLAYVSLAASLLMLLLMLRGPVRRAILRALLYALPVIVLYLAAGRNRHTGIFKPASLIMSVSEQSDASSLTRDIENFNLLQTLKHHMVIGAGWGHEYDEQVKADDISRLFPQYRYVAHNSVLWLWGIGGVVGFTLLWLPIVVGVFLARRAYLFARTPLERTVAFVAVAVIVCFVNQAWGDMGTQGQSCITLLAWALAAAGKLAVTTGAFPAEAELVGSAGPPRPRLDAVATW